MTPKQEETLRDYLQEVIVPLIEEVLVKKLGQAMTFAKKALAEQPAQRTWVGLTEDEVALIAVDCSLVTPSDFYFYQAIEAKLRSKNEDRI